MYLRDLLIAASLKRVAGDEKVHVPTAISAIY